MSLVEELEQYFPRLRERIAQARTTNPSVTEAAVAREADMHPSYLSALFNHPANARVATILKLEAALVAVTAAPPDDGA